MATKTYILNYMCMGGCINFYRWLQVVHVHLWANHVKLISFQRQVEQVYYTMKLQVKVQLISCAKVQNSILAQYQATTNFFKKVYLYGSSKYMKCNNRRSTMILFHNCVDHPANYNPTQPPLRLLHT